MVIHVNVWLHERFISYLSFIYFDQTNSNKKYFIQIIVIKEEQNNIKKY